MQVRNHIKEFDLSRYRERPLTHRVVIHRVGLDAKLGINLGQDALTVAKYFVDNGPASGTTNGKCPYPIIIDQDGVVNQMLPLHLKTPHARAWNGKSVAVACMGDFRVTTPPPRQWKALIDVCILLLKLYCLRPVDIFAHDKLPGGSSDPKKKCPGEFLSIGALSIQIANELRRRAQESLGESGLVG